MKQIIFTIVFLFFYQLIIAQPFQQFTWQTPQYGASKINCTRWMTDHKFIAVGNAGTILQSEDEGHTWVRTVPFTYVDFKGIYIKDTLTFFIVGSTNTGNGKIYKTTDAGITWNLIFNNNTMPLKDIHFANDNVGYCVGDSSKIIKTINGGLTWTDLTNTSILDGKLNTIWFLNSDTGFVGRSSNYSVLKTINGGLSWIIDSSIYYGSCYILKFLNDTLGYVGCANSSLFKTINSGLSWTQVTNINTFQNIMGIDFADLTHGIAVTDSHIHRTNNGINWNDVNIPDSAFTCAAFSPSGNILIGDAYGGLHTASNFSVNYSNNNPNTGYYPYIKIKFADSLNGWILSLDNKLLKTIDGGNTWTEVNTPNFEIASDFAVLSPNKLIIITYAVSYGKVLTTTDGGISWTTQVLSTTEGFRSISFPNVTHGYIVGDLGIAFKTSDGGNSYSPMNLSVPSPSGSYSVFFVNNLEGYAGGSYGLKKTTNGGNTWTIISIPGLYTVKSIYFTDSLTGYVANYYNGLIYRTTDGGTSFTTVGQSCINNPTDMIFINDSTGFITGGNNTYSCDYNYTTDYGMTWNDVQLPFAYNPVGIFAFDLSNIFLTCTSLGVIKTGASGTIASININTNKNNSAFSIFPNPSDGIFQIQSNENCNACNYWIQVFNASGELIYNKMISTNNTNIDLSIYPVGLYVANISSGNKSYAYKISKQ